MEAAALDQNELAAKLEERLRKDREGWMEKIENLVQMMKTITKLSEAQVYMLSYRQILIDKQTELQYTIYRKNSDYEVFYRSKFMEYVNSATKLNGGERDRMVKADLTVIRRQISILESHMDFYKESIKTLDHMAFAIRNRIKLEDDY